MKKVLSLLVLFAFLNVQSWAYAPNYPISSTSVSGVYAGVLIPTNEATTTSSASIGIFAVGIPASTSGTAITQGAGVIFSNGAGYNTTITGVFDPASDKLQAILEGVSNFQIITVVGTQQITSNLFAQGSMTAKLEASNQKSATSSTSGSAGTATAQRLNGTGSVDLYGTLDANGSPIITQTLTFSVQGFQQSTTYAVPTLTIAQGGTGGGTGG